MSQVVVVAASPILTRLYSPSDFGALQVFISLTGLVLVFAAGRYDIAIFLPEDEQSAIDILGLTVACVTLTAVVTAAVVAVCHYCWILPTSVLGLKRYLWLLPISVVGGGLYNMLSSWAMRQGHYKQIATTKFTQAGAQIATQLAGGVVIHGPLGLLVGDAVGRIVGSGRFLRELWRSHRHQIRAIRVSRMIALAVRYREYPLVSMWGTLINTSGLALPSLFMAQYYGARETGWFALVNRVLAIPAALIGTNIAQVYTAEAAKLSRSNPGRLLEIFLKITRRMLYVGFVPCVLFTIFAPWLFYIIFGEAWRGAGEYARYLAFMFYGGLLNSPVNMTLNILQRQRSQFAWDASRLVLTVVGIALPSRFGYGPHVAILFYGTAMAIMYAVHWVMSYCAIRECAGLSPTSSVPSRVALKL